MKQRIEAPVFTWFLVGALLFSVCTFLLGIWVCSNAPRSGYEGGEEVPTVMEHLEGSGLETTLQDKSEPPEQKPAMTAESRTATSSATKTRKTTAVAPKKSKPEKTRAARVTKKPTRKTSRKVTLKASTALSEKIYYVQLTATVNRKMAERMKQKYAGKGYNMYLIIEKKHGKTLYKVRIGVFKDWKKANAIAKKIRREDKLKPWIIAM
ncbi:MAG: SPOR domain-containing protein [Acidobacteria bacterium]|nr:SPOR domain-containing protein [Acidobacteriota bacterium]